MDIGIRILFEETLNWDLISIIISNSIDKNKISKVKIRPILMKDELLFQASEYIAEKVFHTNYTGKDLLNKLPEWLDGLFKQVEIVTKQGNATISNA